jgi:hypothetical protein
MPSKILGVKVTIHAAYMASNGVIHSFLCAVSLVGTTDAYYVNDTV